MGHGNHQKPPNHQKLKLHEKMRLEEKVLVYVHKGQKEFSALTQPQKLPDMAQKGSK